MTDKLTPAEAFQLRSELPNAQFNITDAHKHAMNAFRATVGEASTTAEAIVRGMGSVDPAAFGRFVAGIDLLQQAKNVFCDGVILAAETENRIAEKKRNAADAAVDDIVAKKNRTSGEQIKAEDGSELSHPPATQPFEDSTNSSQDDGEKTQ